MKQAERASIIRIVSDLIKADGIIDTREILMLEQLRTKYNIRKEDEILASSYTLARSVQTLATVDDKFKHELMADFMQLVMSDNLCVRSEALLLLALRACLTIKTEHHTSVLSIDSTDILFEETQILYIESEFDSQINQQIESFYREICAEARLSGFDFVYLPKISAHYRSISESDLTQLAEFLYPKVSLERIQMIVEQLRHLSTADFCKTQLAAKMQIEAFEEFPASFMIKIGDTIVNERINSSFLIVEIGKDVLSTIRFILDLFLENYQNLSLNYLREEQGRFIFTGYYRQIFDILMIRRGVKSPVVIDPFRERIYFPEAEVSLEKVHRREKALYALLLMESASGGISFNKPTSSTQFERHEKRMKAVMRKYQLIYRMFGGEEEKAPNITLPDIRLPMISLIKKQLLKLDRAIHHIEDYTIQRNLYGNYGVRIPSSLCYCCGSDKTDIKPLTESTEWVRIAAL